MTKEIIAIIDNSASMYSLKEDCILGFDNLIKEQKQEEDIYVSLCLFNKTIKNIYTGININSVRTLRDFYKPDGPSCLYDAIGKTLSITKERLKLLSPEDIPNEIIILVITDGLDNSSTTYNKEAIISRIRQAKAEDNWKFIFLAKENSLPKVQSLNLRHVYGYQGSSKSLYHGYKELNNLISELK